MKLKLFFFLFFLFLLSAGGHFYTADGWAMFEAGKNFLYHGDPFISKELLLWGERGLRGKIYAQFGPLQSLLELPSIAFAAWLTSGKPEIPQYNTALFFASFTNTFITALWITIFFSWISKGKKEKKQFLIAALLMGLSSPIWCYAKYGMNEPAFGLFLFALFSFFLIGWKKACRKNIFLAGCMGGLSFFTRQEGAIAWPFLTLLLLFSPPDTPDEDSSPQKRTFRDKFLLLTAWLIPLLGSILLIAVFNKLRFGNFLTTGHEHHGFSFFQGFPFWKRIYVNVFSPAKGLLFYAPVIFTCLFFWFPYAKKHKSEAWIVFWIATPYFLLHMMWHSFMGGWSWGPRRLIPLIPLIALPLPLWIHRAKKSFFILSALLLSALIGFIVNFAGIYMDFAVYLKFSDPSYPLWIHPLIPKTPFLPLMTQASTSPILGHLKMIHSGWKDAWILHSASSPYQIFLLCSLGAAVIFFGLLLILSQNKKAQ